MAGALQALDEINELVAKLAGAAKSGRGKNLGSAETLPIAREMATIYFGSVRAELDVVKSRAGLVEEIDYCVQTILELANSSREKILYIGQTNELRPYLLEATIDMMKSRGAAQLVLSETERAILDTLTSMLPASAASYEQVLRDIAQGGRVSWRGPANELRETLRNVIDHLAPDREVMAAPNFRLETDRTKPTQKQKVRHILKARRISNSAVTTAEGSLATVDEAVASLARSTYDRGSASSHTASTVKEIKNLKRYADALLAELLEIG